MSDRGDERGDLAAIIRAVASLDRALRMDDFTAGKASADRVVAATNRLLGEANRPSAIPPDLSAALQVFRNAAFAFRKLAKSDESSLEALEVACQSLLAQGNDLLETYFRDGR